jgi:hypothetical protein
MSEGNDTGGRAHVGITLPSLASADGWGQFGREPSKLGGRPRLHVQIIERTAYPV